MGTVHELERAEQQAPPVIVERKLIKKLAEIMQAVKYIQKTGYNKFHKYSYATEADVSEAVREQLASRAVMMIPSVLKREVREHKSRSGNTEYIAIVDMEFKFMDGETGEEVVFLFSGEGQDAGDKAIYKAETGTQKYAMMKVFQIPTGDDPELDSGADPQQQPQGQQQGQQQRQQQQQGQQPPQQQNAPQQQQTPPPPAGPTKGQLKAKYKELIGTDSDFADVSIVKKFSGNGAGLMNWLEAQLKEREQLETQVFAAAREKGGEDIKTAVFVLSQLRAGNTYSGILQAIQKGKQ